LLIGLAFAENGHKAKIGRKGAPLPPKARKAKREGRESVDEMIDTTSYDNTQPTDSVPVDSFRLSLNRVEEQRRSKLHAVRRDIEAVVAHPSTRLGGEALDHLAQSVTALVVEIAILDRETDPCGNAEYAVLIDQTLGIGITRSVALWLALSPAPMQTFTSERAAHIERARVCSDPKHHHRKIVDVDAFGPALGLTRARIREIFGDSGCAIKPMKSRPDRFDPETARKLNAFADEIGLTREYVKDVYAVEGDAGLEALKQEGAIERRRSDLKYGSGRRIRGRPPAEYGVEYLVRAKARASCRSRRTIYRWKAKEKAACADLAALTLEAEQNHISVDEQIVYDLNHYAPGRRRGGYPEKELVIEWYTAVEGKPPTPAQMRKWHQRRLWSEKIKEAKCWKLANALASTDSADHGTVSGVKITHKRSGADVGTTGSLRPCHVDPGAEIREDARAQVAPHGP